MLACRTCKRQLSLFMCNSFSQSSAVKPSNHRRPSGFHAAESLKSGNSVAFSADGGMVKVSRYISKEVKYTHAALLPHIALNLSGLGAPFLDYFYHPGIAMGMAAWVVLYPGLFLLPPRITYLSFNESNSTVSVETSFCQQTLEIPFSVCKFRSNQRSLMVCNQKYKFLGGQFNSRNLTILKRNLRATKYEIDSKYSYSRFHLMWKEITSLSYIIVVMMSLVFLALHGFMFGYTDLMYLIIHAFALFIGEEKVMKRWEPLIKS